jgi:hypothetical protein
MKYVQLSVIALFCVAVACTKKKDDNPVPEVETPTNNPTPNKPNDSTTNNPPKVIPVFGDFSPANAFIGDTITLTGNNFATDAWKNTVSFGAVRAEVISASATQLQVVVPDDIEEAKTKIHLSTGDTTISINKDFSLKAPVIESVTPKVGFANQVVTIKGKGFRKSYKFDQVAFGNKIIEKSAIHPNHTTLEVPIPQTMKTGQYSITVTVAGMTATTTDQLQVLVPDIQSLSATTVKMGSEVIIKGENFIDPNGAPTSVFLLEWKTNALSTVSPTILSLTNNEIRIKVPVLREGGGDYKLTLRVIGSIVSYTTTPLTIEKP